MTRDRDCADDAGLKLPTLPFRPWPPRARALPLQWRSAIRPCFVRIAPPATSGAAHPGAREPAGGPFHGLTGQPQRSRRTAHPPRFARFAAALQSTGGMFGPEPALWRVETWADARPGAPARPMAGLTWGVSSA